MSAPYHRVALAGATGNLGPSVLKALVSAGFDVTVLTRSAKVTESLAGVKVVEVDYASQASLVAALQGQDVFISNVPNHGSQPDLIDACIAAGVKRFIPSEFGSNVSGNAKTAALPVFAGKVKTQEHLKEKSSEISWTLIVNSFFFDWALERNFLVQLKSGETEIFDGGNESRSFTTLADVAQAVVGVLRHPEETHNRTVYVQSVSISQNQLLAVAKKVKPEFEPQVKHTTSEDWLKESYAKLEAGGENVGPAMIGFIVTSAFAPGYGNDWAAKNDNELLGVKGLSEKEIEDIVRRYV